VSLAVENNQILLLVASEQGATLCVNCNGVSELVARFSPSRTSSREVSKIANFAHARRPHRGFAAELMGELRRCAVTGAYEGIVIYATYELMKELRAAMDCKVCKLLIGAMLETPRYADRDAAAHSSRYAEDSRSAVR
jgi:protein required for attachment to host cells